MRVRGFVEDLCSFTDKIVESVTVTYQNLQTEVQASLKWHMHTILAIL